MRTGSRSSIPTFAGMTGPLFHSIRDPTLGQIVWRHLDLHLVAGQDADVVLAHAARNMCDHHMAVLELHAEHRVGKRLENRAFHFDDIVFGHFFPWLSGWLAATARDSATIAGAREAKRRAIATRRGPQAKR